VNALPDVWCENSPLPRPCVAPGDRQVSPSLCTLRAGLLLSRGRGSDYDIPLWGRKCTVSTARKHPVTERSEVVVLTSVRGPRSRKWAGEGCLGTSGSESWRPRREAAGGKLMKRKFCNGKR